MGRKKLDFDCKYCYQNTEIMLAPIYVDSYKGHFCGLDCYNLKEKENKDVAPKESYVEL